MKRVVVTGGAGHSGSHTAKALACAGTEPVVLDNLSAGHRWAVQWGDWSKGMWAVILMKEENVASTISGQAKALFEGL